jgi:hypothetical protein
VLGRFLFRWRGVIGVLAFGVVFWLAKPTFGWCLLAGPSLILGLAVRFWASGYIGIEGRVSEIGGQRKERGVRRKEEGMPRRRIVTGPYRILRHPLYVGNFLLVVGMLVALRPALWLSAVVLIGFVAEYGLIVAAEEKELAGRRIQNPESRIQNAEVRFNGSSESIVESREHDRSQKSAVRSQNSEVMAGGPAPPFTVQSPESTGEKQGTVPGSRTGPCEGTVPVFRQRPESFLLSRAMCEWRTWVVTGVGWGLALLKALVAR